MVEFDQNTSQIIAWLRTYGVAEEWLDRFLILYEMLRGFLVRTNRLYDSSVGEKWLREIEKEHDSAYRAYAALAVNLLNRIQKYGTVRLNLKRLSAWEFPESWTLAIQEFATYAQSRYCASWSVRLNEVARQFSLSVQLQGELQTSGINWKHMWNYYGMIGPESHKGSVSAVRVFLRFLTENGTCSSLLSLFAARVSPGLELPVFIRSTGVENKESDISGLGSAEDVFKWSRKICRKLEDTNSKRDTILKTQESLELYALYLWCNGLRHERDLALCWLDSVRPGHETLYLSARRALNILEECLSGGEVSISPIFMPAPALETFPKWCKDPVTEFLKAREKELLASSTLEMDRSSCTRFCQFLIAQHVTDFAELTPELIKRFNLQDSHRTAAGKAAYNGRIRRFLEFLYRAGYTSSPHLPLALPTTAAPAERLIITLNDEEKRAVADYVENADNPLKLRDAACMLLAIEMGLRASDVFTLTFESIDWKNRSIRLCQTKTRKEIWLPMPVSVGNAIFRYLKDGRPRDASSEYVFVSHRAPYAPLKHCAASDIVSRVLPERHFTGNQFHVNRRTFATERMRDGVSRDDIAALLGHRKQSSLAPYLSMDDERMALCPLSLSELGLASKRGESFD